LLAIAEVAAAFGTFNSAPHHEIPAGTWAAEAALSGLGFGLLLGAFMPEPPWRGEARVLAPAGSAVYALSYEIAAVVGYGGGDSGGAGLVFLVIMITCIAPMMIASGVAYRLRDLTRALKRRLWVRPIGVEPWQTPSRPASEARPRLAEEGLGSHRKRLGPSVKDMLMAIGGVALTAFVVLYLVAYISTGGHPWGTTTIDEGRSNPPVASPAATCSEQRWDPVARRWTVVKKLTQRECDNLIKPYELIKP